MAKWLREVKIVNLYRSGNMIEYLDQIRYLTEIEMERLQGFEDNHTQYGVDEDGIKYELSRSNRTKLIGNAVTVPIVAEIVKLLGGIHFEAG